MKYENVKYSKAFEQAGFKETARLVKLLDKTHTVPKSLSRDPLWLKFK